MATDTIDEKKKNQILHQAERCLYFNNLLIEQCDNWLSAEEGNANMTKSIRERRKKKAQIARRNKINSILRFFGMKSQPNKQIFNQQT